MTLSFAETDSIRYKLIGDELETWATVAAIMSAELRGREDPDAKRRFPIVQRNLETLQRSASCIQSEAWRADLQSKLIKFRDTLQSLSERFA
jgi:hypothetical protein